jgi:hypothetical protein
VNKLNYVRVLCIWLDCIYITKCTWDILCFSIGVQKSSLLSGILRGKCWYFFYQLSRQPVGSVLKGKGTKGDCPEKSVQNYQHKLSKNSVLRKAVLKLFP